MINYQVQSLSFFRKVSPIALFLVAIFIVIEISYRFYVVGPIALNPWRANSLNTLMRSEYVRLSQYPDVYFELKEDAEGWFKGVWLSTNSAGLADKEYSRAKPEGVFRIAAVGSSWTMPSGVAQDEAWHAVAERELASETGKQVEFINFGVEFYGLRELVGTVRHKAMIWDPDLIVVAVTIFTSSILWEDATESQALPDRAYPAFQSYSIRALSNRFSWRIRGSADDRTRIDPGNAELRIAQLYRAMSELREATSAPVVIMFLGYVPLADSIEQSLRDEAERLGITAIFGGDLFPESPEKRRQFQISSYDRHPNAAGHRLIADFLVDELQTRELLPNLE